MAMMNGQKVGKKEATPVSGPAPLGQVSCWTWNEQKCGITYNKQGIISFEYCGGIGVRTTLYRGEKMNSVGSTAICNEWGGTQIQLIGDQIYQCEFNGWNDYYLKYELEQELPFDYGNGCDSCAGNLCVKNNECQQGKIRCTGETTFNACEMFTHPYFSPFYRFSDNIQSCPSGYTCNIDICEPSQASICSTLRTTAWNAALAWVSNPTASNKNNAVNSIISWAEAC